MGKSSLKWLKIDRKVINLSWAKKRTNSATRETKKITKDMEMERSIIAMVFASKVSF